MKLAGIAVLSKEDDEAVARLKTRSEAAADSAGTSGESVAFEVQTARMTGTFRAVYSSL